MIVQKLIITEQIQISYPDLDFIHWRSLNSLMIDIIKAIEYRFNLINIYDFNYKGFIESIKDYSYRLSCEEIYWLLLHIDNPFTYNTILNKFSNILINNYNNYLNKEETKNITIKNTKPKNKFYRTKQKNLFTNEIEYDYINPITKEKVSSKDPNLENELNKKQKKVKNNKVSTISLDMMTFNFNKKK